MMVEAPTPAIRLGAQCAQCTDAWLWVALYSDGEMLAECPGDDKSQRHHGFADIDLDRVVSMALIPQRDGLQQIVVQLSDGMRPVFFRRRYIELNVAGGDVSGRQNIHCLGFQKNLDDGTNVQSFTFAFEDGSVLLSADRNAV